jgi:phage gp36-like protein
MAYCSQADIVTLYSQELIDLLGDGSGSGGLSLTTDNARIAAAISAASGIIDAYLTVKYALPIANPPEILKQLAIDIVVYRLALFPLSRTEEMRKRYDDAVAFLKTLALGTTALPIQTAAQAAAAASGGTPATTPPATGGAPTPVAGAFPAPGFPAVPPRDQNFRTRVLTLDVGIEVPLRRRLCDCWRADYYGARNCDCERSLR